MLRIESPCCPRLPSRLMTLMGAIFLVSALFSSASFAQDVTPRPRHGPDVMSGQTTADPPCFCWSDGKKIAEGLTACIRTANGRRLAECGRVINLMSWQISDEICPES
jgi:hypothetical protein